MLELSQNSDKNQPSPRCPLVVVNPNDSTLQAERAAWLKVIKLEKEREDREHEKWLKQERERKVSFTEGICLL